MQIIAHAVNVYAVTPILTVCSKIIKNRVSKLSYAAIFKAPQF